MADTNYYYGSGETRDGESEYLHHGVCKAESVEQADELFYRLFAYDVCPHDCENYIPEGDARLYDENDCDEHGNDYRITTVGEVREIPQSDYEVLSRYL